MTAEIMLDQTDILKNEFFLFGQDPKSENKKQASILTRYIFPIRDYYFTGIFYLKESFLDSYTAGFYLPDVSGKFELNNNRPTFSINQITFKIVLMINFEEKRLQWQYYDKIKGQQWKCHGWNTVLSF